VQKVSDSFHLHLLLTITGSIFVLSLAVVILTITDRNVGSSEGATGGRKGDRTDDTRRSSV